MKQPLKLDPVILRRNRETLELIELVKFKVIGTLCKYKVLFFIIIPGAATAAANITVANKL